MDHPVTVTILGCRGSIPVSGKKFARYGGASLCVLVRAGDAIAVLDAGTGILNLPPHLHDRKAIPIFPEDAGSPQNWYFHNHTRGIEIVSPVSSFSRQS